MKKTLEKLIKHFLSASLITSLLLGCNYSSKVEAKEPSQKQSSSLEDKTHEDCKIVFISDRLDVLTGKEKTTIDRNISGMGNVCTMNADGSDVRRLTKFPLYKSPSWSPDGKKIVFTESYWNSLYVMNPDGNDIKQLTSLAEFENVNPSWSPDSKKIAFERRGDRIKISTRDQINPNGIYVMNANGSNVRRLTKDSPYDSGMPAFSPDGKKIAFTSDSGYQIYVMNAEGTEQKNLTKNEDHRNLYPSFSPDSKRIVFTSNRDNNFDIYIMNADGSDVKRLTKTVPWANVSNSQPSFSPDGKKIAFTKIFYNSKTDNNDEIYVMNADGTEQKNLTNNLAMDNSPAWSPILKK